MSSPAASATSSSPGSQGVGDCLHRALDPSRPCQATWKRMYFAGVLLRRTNPTAAQPLAELETALAEFHRFGFVHARPLNDVDGTFLLSLPGQFFVSGDDYPLLLLEDRELRHGFVHADELAQLCDIHPGEQQDPRLASSPTLPPPPSDSLFPAAMKVHWTSAELDVHNDNLRKALERGGWQCVVSLTPTVQTYFLQLRTIHTSYASKTYVEEVLPVCTQSPSLSSRAPSVDFFVLDAVLSVATKHRVPLHTAAVDLLEILGVQDVKLLTQVKVTVSPKSRSIIPSIGTEAYVLIYPTAHSSGHEDYRNLIVRECWDETVFGLALLVLESEWKRLVP